MAGELVPTKKKAWQSKTLIIGAITAIAPFIPGVSEWIAANDSMFVSGLGLVFMLLRVVTKDKVVID